MSIYVILDIDVYDEEKYKKSQLYLKENTRFGFVSETVSLIVTLAFIFLGGYKYLDDFIRNYSDSDYVLGLLFIGIISIFVIGQSTRDTTILTPLAGGRNIFQSVPMPPRAFLPHR